MHSPDDQVIEEIEITDTPPSIFSPAIQRKNNEDCLRRSDEVTALETGGFKVVRQWIRPGSHPWSRFEYPVDFSFTTDPRS